MHFFSRHKKKKQVDATSKEAFPEPTHSTIPSISIFHGFHSPFSSHPHPHDPQLHPRAQQALLTPSSSTAGSSSSPSSPSSSSSSSSCSSSFSSSSSSASDDEEDDDADAAHPRPPGLPPPPRQPPPPLGPPPAVVPLPPMPPSGPSPGTQNHAATLLEQLFRRKHAREQFLQKQRENDAAMTLEAVFRSRHAKEEVQAMREEQAETAAALELETMWRARQARKLRAHMMREDEAAHLLVHQLRHQKFKHELARQHERRVAAARVLQRRWRGHQHSKLDEIFRSLSGAGAETRSPRSNNGVKVTMNPSSSALRYDATANRLVEVAVQPQCEPHADFARGSHFKRSKKRAERRRPAHDNDKDAASTLPTASASTPMRLRHAADDFVRLVEEHHSLLLESRRCLIGRRKVVPKKKTTNAVTAADVLSTSDRMEVVSLILAAAAAREGNE